MNSINQSVFESLSDRDLNETCGGFVITGTLVLKGVGAFISGTIAGAAIGNAINNIFGR